LDNNNARIFAKKELKYLCAHLNRKNQSLFNTRAKTHIIKLFDDFNTNTYVPVSLLLINIISGEIMPLSFGKKKIIYTIDIKREMYTLNFSKM